jgi:SpoVK/Ycf46/Vps4 family AAA+-type ATPase
VQDPFSSLQIDPGHKDTTEILLYTHFEKKTLDRGPGPAIPDQDLIRGKGRGAVFLLHGAPGVGKTATAKAVAQKYGTPLFSISCGDLGYQPDKVESALTEIFQLAQVWDCILLLDEADVFLIQCPNDLKRNTMVSSKTTTTRIVLYLATNTSVSYSPHS